MLFIIVGCGIMVIAIGIRLWLMFHGRPTGQIIKVEYEWKEAFNAAERAQKEIFTIESKVWVSNETLKPEQYKRIGERLETLRNSAEKMHELMEKIRKLPDGPASQEAADIPPRLLKLKFWILDADGVVESEKDTSKQAGYFIPLFTMINRWHEARKEIQTVEKTKAEILQRNDAEEKKTIRERIAKIQTDLGRIAEKIAALDDYVKDGLARQDLTTKEIPDLEPLRDEQALVLQTINQIRRLKADFTD
jgi:hypothetical protein